ncbi:MAG: hypothetical protein QXY34_01340 [Candidatus Bathyarchaeia archaeon]
MEKLELMKKFMQTFVGNGFYLIIKDGGYFIVHTIEIYQKEDESCPLSSLPMGDYFMRLLVRDSRGRDAAVLCDWSMDLLQSLLESYEYAREAGYDCLLMVRSPLNPDEWLIMWGDKMQNYVKVGNNRKNALEYIS